MSVDKALATMTARWRRAGYPDFAWWIPLAMDGFAVSAAAIAAVQREAHSALLPASLLMLLAISPWLVAMAGFRVPWPLFLAVTLGASTVVIVRYPVDYDFALLVWVMLVGHIGTCESLLRSLAATTAAAAALFGLAVLGEMQSLAFWLAALVVGSDIGLIMRWQQLRLDEQARTHRHHEAAAVLEERQRIAREVHDVVAHSLSVTMLHLTAARRSLEEDRAEGVDEAIDALRDAENVGRQAMTDIRTTVGLLGDRQGTATAAPDLRDLPALVEEFRAAGLDVTLDLRGDTSSVPPNACLSLFRIVQESLANVAKHEPRSTAVVRLDCLRHGQQLVVSNTLVTGRAQQAGGSGLKGMGERAQLLGGSFQAGPREGRWTVEVTLPAPESKPGRGCTWSQALALPVTDPA